VQKVNTAPPENATHVVTCFVTRDGKVLLLRRSQRVGTYRGLWAGVSGYLENDPPEARAWIELEEEVGITKADATLDRAGEPLDVRDDAEGRLWRVHPFRFALRSGVTPRLDWESVAFKWALPGEIATLETVPGLLEAWQRISR
jgi:hypothetical protein